IALGRLGLDQALEDVLAEGLADDLVLLQLLDRLAERGGEHRDVAALEVLVGEVIEILLHRVLERQLIDDAVHAGRQHRREGEVRIAGRIRAAQLDAGRVVVTLADGRNADQRRAVRPGPGDVDRSLVAGNQAAVAVDQRRDDGGEAARVLQLTSDEVPGNLGKAVRIALIDEGVLALALVDESEALVDVHAGTVDALDRLGHEGGMQAMALGDRLQDVLEGDGAVGGRDGRAVLEVDLVLADGDLVVAGLDLDAHLLKVADHVLADVGGEVARQVEVAAPVVRQRGDALTISREEEELQLRSGVEGVAKLGELLDLAVQDVARVARERIAVWIVNPAEDAGGREFTALPRHAAERGEVRLEVHVRFGDASETGDGGTIDPLAALDDVGEPLRREGHLLDDAHDIGELEVNELDPLALDLRKDFFGIRPFAQQRLAGVFHHRGHVHQLL